MDRPRSSRRRPRPGGNDQLRGRKLAGVGSHSHAALICRPLVNLSVGQQRRARRLGRREICRHAIFDEQVAGVRLENAHEFIRHAQSRPPLSISRGRDLFDRQPMLGRRSQHARHDDAIRRPDFEQADLDETAACLPPLPTPATTDSFP